MERPQSGGKSEGKECAGRCKHSSTWHQVKWLNKDENIYQYGCSYVDCQCMKYVPSNKDNTQIR